MQDWQIQSRERLGLEIAALKKLDRKGGVWIVPSQSGRGHYTVCPDPTEPHCTCPDHTETGQRCKHIYAVEFVVSREQNEDDTVIEAVPLSKTTVERPTYRQDWANYNLAQVNEKRAFRDLLYDLCQNIPQIKRGRGRPPLPLSDALFSVVMKVYSTVSARRFVRDLDEAYERGYLTKPPHYNSISNYLENPALTRLLHDLITATSLPLRTVEADFAVDSTGFTGRSYTPLS
jgi:hypothetical protein